MPIYSYMLFVTSHTHIDTVTVRVEAHKQANMLTQCKLYNYFTLTIRPITFVIVDAFDRDSLQIQSNHITKILELSPAAIGSSVTLIVYVLNVSC